MSLLRSLLVATFCVFAAQATADLKIVAMGDMPYGDPKQSHPSFKALINEINKTKPDLVIHVGDILDGETPCKKATHQPLIKMLNSVDAPVIFTPGDNDWSDCHRKAAGRYNQLKRLEKLRDLYFPIAGRTLGAKPAAVAYDRSNIFRENVRWEKEGVVVLTLHVVGPNDARTLKGKKVSKNEAKKAFAERRAANLDWLEKSFEEAKDATAVVIALHADMFKYRDGEGFDSRTSQTWAKDSPFKEIGEAIANQSKAFGKPVLLIYGSGHTYTNWTPLSKTAPSLQAVEVPGDTEMHAVQVLVRGSPAAFVIDEIINPELAN